MNEAMTWQKRFVEWVEDLCRYGHEPLRYIQWDTRTVPPEPTVTLRAKVFTDRSVYSISASENYLGCIASARKQRAGETWTRGSDLPDGKFCVETWQRILLGIVRYELVALEGKPTPEAVADEAVASA